MVDRIKLTKTTVERLEAPPSGYSLTWDAEIRGFGVRVTAAGARTFILQRRINGREHRMKIGRFGDVTAEAARKIAKAKTGLIAGGGDPVAAKARDIASKVTLAAAIDSYLAARKSMKPSTAASYRVVLQRALPDWMDKRLADVNATMVLRRHAHLGERGEAYANLAMRYLRAVFNFAREAYVDAKGQPIIAANPVERIGKTRGWYRVERRDTYIKPDQMPAWFAAVLGLENVEARDYFLMLVLTGLRRSEALGLLWSDIDLQARTLTVRETKNGRPHTLPLSDYLHALLARRHAESVGDYVFSGTHGRLSNLRFPLAEVAEKSGVRFTPHDLRRTFATVADSLDISAFSTKQLLNHTASDVTAGYIGGGFERLRMPMQRITDYMLKAALLKAGAAVVRIREPQAGYANV